MLELAMGLLTGGVVATFLPKVRKAIPRPVEVVLWMAFIGASLMTVARVSDPKLREVTASILWAAGQVAGSQLADVAGSAREWAVVHRFDIAAFTALAAGADVVALALMRANRTARRMSPRVHLAEFFEIPQPVRAPAYAGTPNPLAAIDRRLAEASRAGLHRLTHSVERSRLFVRLELLYAHALRPGRRRLHVVKMALGIGPHVDEAPASAQTVPEPIPSAFAAEAGRPAVSPRPRATHARTSPQRRRTPRRAGVPPAGALRQ